MKAKTTALVLGAFSAITLWSRPTTDNFFCDFEWMPEPLYSFMDFSQLNYRILHDGVNGFMRISGKFCLEYKLSAVTGFNIELEIRWIFSVPAINDNGIDFIVEIG